MCTVIFYRYTLLPFNILLLFDISCAIDMTDVFHFPMTLFPSAKAIAIYPKPKMYVFFPLRERWADEIVCSIFFTTEIYQSPTTELSGFHLCFFWSILCPLLHISFGISLILKHLLEKRTKQSLRKKLKRRRVPYLEQKLFSVVNLLELSVAYAGLLLSFFHLGMAQAPHRPHRSPLHDPWCGSQPLTGLTHSLPCLHAAHVFFVCIVIKFWLLYI